MKTIRLIQTVALAATFAVATYAQSVAVSRSDRHFIEKAAKVSAKEVDISSAVMAKLPSSSTRDFAQMLVTDHTRANVELAALASRKGVILPVPDQKPARKWAKNDKDVVDEYLATMVDDHQEAVKLFEKAVASEDADIAAFAQQTLPTLRHHLEQAKVLRKVN